VLPGEGECLRVAGKMRRRFGGKMPTGRVSEVWGPVGPVGLSAQTPGRPRGGEADGEVAGQLLLRRGGLSQTTHPAVGAVPRTQDLLGRRGGADGGDAARAQAGQGGGPAGEIGDRPADVGAMADVVAGDVRGEPVLEGGTRPVHAGALSADTPLVVGRGLWDRSVGSPARVAAVPAAVDDGLGAGTAGSLREEVTPAEDAR